MDDVMAKVKEMKDQGLEVPVDHEDLRRERLELQADAVQLRLGIDTLSSELRQRLGTAASECEQVPVRPVMELDAAPLAIDRKAALAEALARRPQLLMLRAVQCDLDAETLPAVRALLGSANGLLNMDSQKSPGLKSLLIAMLCHRKFEGAEVDKSRDQVRQLLIDREQAVIHEVEQAVRTAEAQTELESLARERVAIRHAKMVDLDKKQAKGLTSFAETSRAKTEWLKARSEVVKEVASRHIALVKLKQAQGILAADCSPGHE